MRVYEHPPSALQRYLLKTSALETCAVKKKFGAGTASSDSEASRSACGSGSRPSATRGLGVDDIGGCTVLGGGESGRRHSSQNRDVHPTS